MAKKLNWLIIVFPAVLTLALAACGPKYPDCEEDKHCKDHGEFCVDKKCQQCREDAHCNAQDPCKICTANYTCGKKTGCCTSDLDCPGGKCWLPPGETVGQCAQCLIDTDCPENYKCVAGKCAPKAECTADADCEASRGKGYKCQDGYCVLSQCKLDPIYFDFDEFVITSQARTTLESNYKCLKERGQAITVEGNCDERGTDEYNLALGSRRANAAKEYLKKLGFAASQMSTHSWGEEKPLCYEHDEACWWKNRRADFLFK